MTQIDLDDAVPRPPRMRRQFWADVMEPCLQAGAVGACCGMTYGIFAGITFGHPVVYAISYGFQGFTMGIPSWATRSAVLRNWDKDKVTPNRKLLASSAAGAVGGIFKSFLDARPRLYLTGIAWALAGAGGQQVINMWDSAVMKEGPIKESKSWLDSKWSPMKRLTDEEYKKLLQDKISKVDADIETIDEKIKALRDTEVTTKALPDEGASGGAAQEENGRK